MTTENSSAPIAVVTGAAGGIGRATTLRLIAGGWRVAGVDRAGLADVPAEFGGCFLSIESDLTDPAAPAEVIARTVRHFGALGLLVNNAGISGARPVAETDDANLAGIMDINFTVPFRMSREALKVMEPGSSIVHVSSVLNFRATPSTSAYTASKAALAGLTRQMAADYGPRGIRCNAVAPGLVVTDLTAEKLRTDPKFQRIWNDGTPWPRLGRPDDIAAAIAFLASADAEFINGHTLVIDGGWSIGAAAA